MQVRCPYCQSPAEIPASGEYTCAQCRAVFRVDLGPAAAEAPRPPGELAPPQPQAGVAPEPPSPLPWDNRDKLGFLAAFRRTTTDVLFRPTAHFRAMPRSGELGSPFLFLLVWLAIGAVAQAVISIPSIYAPAVALPPELLEMLREAGLPPELAPQVQQGLRNTPTTLVIGTACGPFMKAIAFVILGPIMHLGLVMTGGARHGVETTLRVLFYWGAFQVFWVGAAVLFVPAALAAGGFAEPGAQLAMAGAHSLVGLVNLVWGLPVMIIGYREAHATTTGRALGALLIFVLLFACCCLIPIGLGIASGLAQR